MITPVNNVHLACPSSALNKNTPSFKSRMQIRKTNLNSIEKNIPLKSTILNFVSKISKIFGNELLFDTTTHNLCKIKKYEKLNDNKRVLKRVKTYNPQTEKLLAVDEYTNGKLTKSSGYYTNGKSLKYTCEYSNEKDTITEFAPDGRTITAIQVDKGNHSYRTEYDAETGNFKSKKVFKDDELTSVRKLEKNTETIETYKNGIISESETKHQSGKIEKINIRYNSKGEQVNGKYTYKNKSEHMDVEWKGDNIIYEKYINSNQHHFTKIKNRKTGEETIVFHSKTSKIKNS